MLETMVPVSCGAMILFVFIHGYVQKPKAGGQYKPLTIIISFGVLLNTVVLALVDKLVVELVFVDALILLLFAVGLVNFLATARKSEWVFVAVILFLANLPTV